MIHYHGTPVGGSRIDAERFLRGRHALIPFTYKNDMAIAADVCQSFILDNGAFSIWRRGGELNIEDYAKWVSEWIYHPGFDFAILPDAIDGDERENDLLIASWPRGLFKYSAPVWHLHEDIGRLKYLCSAWRVVAIGSSGEYKAPGSSRWWDRINEAMGAACDESGRPKCKLHGLRMLSPRIFEHIPLSSADSTNATQNSGAEGRFGMYPPPTSAQRGDVIAARIEVFNSAPIWRGTPEQGDFFK